MEFIGTYRWCKTSFGDGREDDVTTGFTTNVQGTQFVNINDEGSVFDYKPNIPDTNYS